VRASEGLQGTARQGCAALCPANAAPEPGVRASQAGAYVILASAINRKADYLADLRETDVFSLKISHAAAGGDDSVADVRSNSGVQGDAPRAAAPDAGR
jgi:hypothetical protein